jgi:hypothetical protein
MPNPPPPQQKKRGLGCLGCGCLVLALMGLLLLTLVGGSLYLGYSWTLALTSATPAGIPSYDGGDDLYNTARQKISAFDHDLENHQAATIHLNANEINTLIAREPSLTRSNIHLFVTMSDDQAKIQWVFPGSLVPYHLFDRRYINGMAAFRVNFDLNEKAIHFDPQSVQVGDKTLLNPDVDSSSGSPDASTNQSFLQAVVPAFNTSFNNALRKDPDTQKFLDQLQSIEIKNGELVIETK